MKYLFNDKAFRGLVYWSGLWQAIHLALNIAYTLGRADFPPAPPEGWTEQATHIFEGLVASDIVQSLVALAFVGGYVTRKRWSFVLGLVSLSSSMFNSFSFTYFMVGTGAWAAHATDFVIIQVLWSPLVVLFFWICHAFAREGEADEQRVSGQAVDP
jgi:hypothetical protein